jgi:hypothetical protein
METYKNLFHCPFTYSLIIGRKKVLWKQLLLFKKITLFFHHHLNSIIRLLEFNL